MCLVLFGMQNRTFGPYLEPPRRKLHSMIAMPRTLKKDLEFRVFLNPKPKLCTLQEVDHPADFQDALEPLGYECATAMRTGGRSDGCVTFWWGTQGAEYRIGRLVPIWQPCIGSSFQYCLSGLTPLLKTRVGDESGSRVYETNGM
jgi:hypothetical protein